MQFNSDPTNFARIPFFRAEFLLIVGMGIFFLSGFWEKCGKNSLRRHSVFCPRGSKTLTDLGMFSVSTIFFSLRLPNTLTMTRTHPNAPKNTQSGGCWRMNHTENVKNRSNIQSNFSFFAIQLLDQHQALKDWLCYHIKCAQLRPP